ncbi:titin isoform X3 [Ochlerotatus camptorhynchus]|uniref:titin isoform X3 n=1 Tax=Ochlerotatus camptorhynchus TaxID=644619 RepID=UPI0031E0A27F
MVRLSVWVLLGLALFTLSVHDLQVSAETPTEYECRPYIEKALHELRAGETDTVSKEDATTEDVTTEEPSSSETPIDVTSQEEEDNTAAEETSIEQDVPEPEQLTASEEVQEALFDNSTEQPIEGSEENAEGDEEVEETEEVTASEEEEEDDDEVAAAEDEEEEDEEAQTDEAVTESQEQEAEAEDDDDDDEGADDEDKEDATSADAEDEDDTDADASDEATEDAEEDDDDDDEVTESQEDATLSEEAAEKEADEDSDADDGEDTEEEISAEATDQENEEDKDEDDEDKSDDDDEEAKYAAEVSEEAEEVDEDEDDEMAASAEEEEEEQPSAEVETEAEASSEAAEKTEEASNEAVEEPAVASEEIVEEVSVETSEETAEPVEEQTSEENVVSVEETEPVEEVVAESTEEAAVIEEAATEESAEEAEVVPEPVVTEEEASEEVAQKVEVTSEEATPVSEEATPDSEEAVEAAAEESTEESEPLPEEDLLLEYEIPTNLRDTSHVYELLHINDQSAQKEEALQKVAGVILRDLKKIYDTAIKPLENLYKYRDLSNRHFGDPEIFSKPLILFMGPWSGGKSTILNYLTHNEYTPNSVRTGAEPSPAYFNILMHGDEPEVLDGTQLAADWTFSGLQKFGQGLLDRLRGHKLPNKLLERVNIVEIPGILEVRKQVSQYFPFNDACQWFIDRADIIFLVYDPSKLDVGPETEAILDQLKGREYQTRILLNKADQVKPEELLRVQGALIWNISPLMSSAQPPVMYTVSLWSNPFETGAPVRLLQAQERSLLLDLGQAIDKRIENKIASARRFAVRVRNHAKMVDCYLTTYYNHKTLFTNKKHISEQIIGNPQQYHIYEGLSTLTNISRYDLPDPDVYRDFFHLNPLYEFQKLSETCTYFRGCPINKLDIAIAYDLPELIGKYKKLADAAIEKLKIPSQTTDFGRGKSSS